MVTKLVSEQGMGLGSPGSFFIDWFFRPGLRNAGASDTQLYAEEAKVKQTQGSIIFQLYRGTTENYFYGLLTTALKKQICCLRCQCAAKAKLIHLERSSSKCYYK